MVATILIAVDDEAMRERLKAAVLGVWDVVGDAVDEAEAVEMARDRQPDVVLVAADLPPSGGLPVVPRIRAAHPAARVVLLTGHDEEAYLGGTGRGGVDAYLPARLVRTDALAVLREVGADLFRRGGGLERRRTGPRDRRRSVPEGRSSPRRRVTRRHLITSAILPELKSRRR